MPTNKKKTKPKTLTPKSAVEELLGTTLLSPKNTDSTVYPTKPTKEVFKDKRFVLLYFSCKSYHCERFSPDLKTFYDKFSEQGKFEVVYVSSDNTLKDFDDNFATMPWVAIPNDDDGYHVKKKLAEQLKISTVPVLVMLQVETGKFVTKKAHTDIQQVARQNFSEAAAMKVIGDWTAIQAKPIEEGVQEAQIDSLLWTILRNPLWIILFFYVVKWFKNRSSGSTGDATASVEGDEF